TAQTRFATQANMPGNRVGFDASRQFFVVSERCITLGPEKQSAGMIGRRYSSDNAGACRVPAAVMRVIRACLPLSSVVAYNPPRSRRVVLADAGQPAVLLRQCVRCGPHQPLRERHRRLLRAFPE